MQIIRQQNAIKSHFSIIPYGITMSKIFRCLFLVLHLHYLPFSLFFSYRAWNGVHAQKNGNSV